MRLSVFSVVVILLLSSCTDEVQEVSFRMKAEGFELVADPDPEGVFGDFKQVIYGGLITFEGEQEIHTFDLRGKKMEDFTFQLPVGEYMVKAGNGPASIYGQKAAAFKSQPFSVGIDEQTDTLSLEIEADCALVLVQDELLQLDHGSYMIERHSYAHGFFESYPLTSDENSGLYYAYFRPDTLSSDPSAFIWFYDGVPGASEGGLPTYNMQIGFQYHIKVLE